MLRNRFMQMIAAGQDPGAVSMRMLAAQAGLSKATYYRHRDEWTVAALEESLPPAAQEALRAIKGSSTFDQRPQSVMQRLDKMGFAVRAIDDVTRRDAVIGDVEFAVAAIRTAVQTYPGEAFSPSPPRPGSTRTITPVHFLVRWTGVLMRMKIENALYARVESIDRQAGWVAVHATADATLTTLEDAASEVGGGSARPVDELMGVEARHIWECWAYAAAWTQTSWEPPDVDVLEIGQWSARHLARARVAAALGILDARAQRRRFLNEPRGAADRAAVRDAAAVIEPLKSDPDQQGHAVRLWMASRDHEWITPLMRGQLGPSWDRIRVPKGAQSGNLNNPLVSALALKASDDGPEGVEGLVAAVATRFEGTGAGFPSAGSWGRMPATAIRQAILSLLSENASRARAWLEVLFELSASDLWPDLPVRWRSIMTPFLRSCSRERLPLVSRGRKVGERRRAMALPTRIQSDVDHLLSELEAGAVIDWSDLQVLRQCRETIDTALAAVERSGHWAGGRGYVWLPTWERRIVTGPPASYIGDGEGLSDERTMRLQYGGMEF